MLSHYSCIPEKLHKLQYWIGIPVIAGALAFITYRIWTNWITIGSVISQIKIGVTLKGLGILSLSATLLGWNWVSVLLFCGIQVPRLNGMRAYFLANLARYIPGGIWHFVGRTLWLVSQGHNPQRAVESLVLEQGIILIAGIGTGFVFMRFILLSPLVLGFFVLVLLSVLLSVMHGSCERPPWIKWFVLLVNYIVFWILYGVANLYFAAAIVDDIGTVTDFSPTKIIGQAILSWVVGYVIFFVPGGWGVRELAFMYLLSQDFSGNIVFILPVLSRLAQILAEIICGGFFLLLGQFASSLKILNLPDIHKQPPK